VNSHPLRMVGFTYLRKLAKHPARGVGLGWFLPLMMPAIFSP
jgi:hypothetical protein